jgi:hypothetical protein
VSITIVQILCYLIGVLAAFTCGYAVCKWRQQKAEEETR